MKFYMIATMCYIVINLIAFVVYGVDKRKAEEGKWRVPERTLIAFAVFGGGIGSLLGMLSFHHKTKKTKFRVLVPLFLVIHIIMIIYFTYQNNHLVDTEYSFDTVSMNKNQVNCNIVQISDLHNVQLWFDEDYIPKRVADLNPDIIVVTGDVVDFSRTDIQSAVYTMNELCKLADTYYVTGNHEYELSEEKRELLFEEMKKAGVIILNDEYTIISGYGAEFALVGIDDRSLRSDVLKDIIKDINDNYGKEMLTVALCHEPQNIEKYSDSVVDIIFAGHDHGGQVVLPGGKPLVAPDQGLFPQYTQGVVTMKSTNMVVSRGLGNSVIPFRINNYPELIHVSLY